MPSFPSTDPDALKVLRGAGRFYYAPYIAAGTDGTFAYGGQVQAGGISINQVTEFFDIDGEEGRAPIDSFVTKEPIEITFNLLEAPIELINILRGAEAGNVATGVGTKTMSLGGVQAGGIDSGNAPLYQVAIESPNEVALRTERKLGYYQLWKTRMMLNGEVVISRDAPLVVPVKITAFWDFSVTAVVGDKGYLGRKVVTT